MQAGRGGESQEHGTVQVPSTTSSGTHVHSHGAVHHSMADEVSVGPPNNMGQCHHIDSEFAGVAKTPVVNEARYQRALWMCSMGAHAGFGRAESFGEFVGFRKISESSVFSLRPAATAPLRTSTDLGYKLCW